MFSFFYKKCFFKEKKKWIFKIKNIENWFFSKLRSILYIYIKVISILYLSIRLKRFYRFFKLFFKVIEYKNICFN